jgi:ABC-2 type transport system ATP-binding protein
MLCGFIASDSGEITFRGKSVSGDHQTMRHMVGVCPQEIVIWEQLTCLEQLVFIASMYGVPAKEARNRATHLLESLNLQDKVNAKGKTLSGGMKRRLNLLLALMHDPPIILLDEPEAGLDPQSRIIVRKFVKSLANKKTIIMTSHNMDEIDRIADRVGIMNSGKLLVVDAPEKLKNSIGEGDLLKIEISKCDDQLVSRGLKSLKSIKPNLQVSYMPGIYTLRSLHVVDYVADSVNALRKLDVPVRNIEIRENTLEDVFISLTGRSLVNENS